MRWGGRYRDGFTVNVNWEGCWQSKNPAKEGEDELVLSGSGNKAEEGSNNPHMRFINALAVDLVVPLKYFGLSLSLCRIGRPSSSGHSGCSSSYTIIRIFPQALSPPAENLLTT